jgi:RimJ/RimL family protein N-acetyltransferase
MKLAPFPTRWAGRRVVLRAMTPADITPAYIGWLNDPVVVRHSNQRFVRHDRDSCERYLASFAGSDNLFLSLRLQTTDEAIGTLTAYRHAHHGTADIGILLGERRVWGQGLGGEAFALLADWLARHGGARKLTCGTLSCNEAMLRVAEAAGFVREAVRPAQEIVDGQPAAIVYFSRFTAHRDAVPLADAA